MGVGGDFMAVRLCASLFARAGVVLVLGGGDGVFVWYGEYCSGCYCWLWRWERDGAGFVGALGVGGMSWLLQLARGLCEGAGFMWGISWQHFVRVRSFELSCMTLSATQLPDRYLPWSFP